MSLSFLEEFLFPSQFLLSPHSGFGIIDTAEKSNRERKLNVYLLNPGVTFTAKNVPGYSLPFSNVVAKRDIP